MEPRNLRAVSAVFGLLLMAMLGGILLLVVGQQLAPPFSPTPLANLSPSPPSPTATPIETPLPSLTGTPAPPSPTPPLGPSTPSPAAPVSPPPTPEQLTPTAEPPPTPAAPTREATFTELGLDSALPIDEEEVTTPRFFTFGVDGPGTIRANLSAATGRIRACLWQGDPRSQADPRCQTLRRGSLEQDVPGVGAQTWTLSLIGADVADSPSVVLRLEFPTNDVRISLEGFRFQGVDIGNYNGLAVEVRAAFAGMITVNATFDDGLGGAHRYRLIVEEIDGGPAHTFVEEGEGVVMAAETNATAERSYRITLENGDPIADELILLSAQLDWP